MSALKVALLTMSTRNPSVGPTATAWVRSTIESSGKSSAVSLSTVAVGDFKLPVLDETAMPAMVSDFSQFAHEHSRAWSTEIAKHDAYILVIPEYNYGMAGGTKNA